MSGEILSQSQPDERIQDSLQAHIYADGSKAKMDEHYQLMREAAQALADAEAAGERALAENPVVPEAPPEQASAPEVAEAKEVERKPLDLELMREIAEMEEERDFEKAIADTQALLEECRSIDANAETLNNLSYRIIEGLLDRARYCLEPEISAKQLSIKVLEASTENLFPEYTHKVLDAPESLVRAQEKLLILTSNVHVGLRRHLRSRRVKFYRIPANEKYLIEGEGVHSEEAKALRRHFNIISNSTTSIRAEDSKVRNLSPSVVTGDKFEQGAVHYFRFQPDAEPIMSPGTVLAKELKTNGLENESVKNDQLEQITARLTSEVREKINANSEFADQFEQFAEKLCLFAELISRCEGPSQVEELLRTNFDLIYFMPDDLALTGKFDFENNEEFVGKHLDLLWSLWKLREVTRICLRGFGIMPFQAEPWEYVIEEGEFYDRGGEAASLPAYADWTMAGVKGPSKVFAKSSIKTRDKVWRDRLLAAEEAKKNVTAEQ